MSAKMSLAFSMDDFSTSMEYAISRGYHETGIGSPVMALFQNSDGIWVPATASGTAEKVSARIKGDSTAFRHDCPEAARQTAIPIHADVVAASKNDFRDMTAVFLWAKVNGPILHEAMARKPVFA